MIACELPSWVEIKDNRWLMDRLTFLKQTKFYLLLTMNLSNNESHGSMIKIYISSNPVKLDLELFSEKVRIYIAWQSVLHFIYWLENIHFKYSVSPSQSELFQISHFLPLQYFDWAFFRLGLPWVHQHRVHHPLDQQSHCWWSARHHHFPLHVRL